ncbi:MAG: tol-pal system YbgF family protein [Thermoanaerobaculales bacterium]
MRLRCRLPVVLCALLACGSAAAEDFDAALERARESARRHRYTDVVEILTPFNVTGDPEIRYITAAEIGRAYFHLGRYQPAHQAFREAAKIHPERVETALYLEATSYLLGHREQAFMILREILRSGARDLYLAVTLPGERKFLADPEVRALIDEFAVVLDVDLERGAMLGITLGDTRERVVEKLEAKSSDPTARGLTASAGPYPIWAFIFDATNRLEEILLYPENLVKYTPYQLHIGGELDWRVTPAKANAVLGAPVRTAAETELGIAITWDIADLELTLDFGQPRTPRPPGIADGTAMLRALRLRRKPGGHPADPR